MPLTKIVTPKPEVKLKQKLGDAQSKKIKELNSESLHYNQFIFREPERFKTPLNIDKLRLKNAQIMMETSMQLSNIKLSGRAFADLV